MQRKFYVAFALHFCNANLVFRCNRRATKAFMRLLFLEVFYHLTHFSFSKHKKRLVIGSKFCNKPAFKLSFHLLLWRRPLQRKIFVAFTLHFCNANLRFRCNRCTTKIPLPYQLFLLHQPIFKIQGWFFAVFTRAFYSLDFSRLQQSFDILVLFCIGHVLHFIQDCLQALALHFYPLQTRKYWL